PRTDIQLSVSQYTRTIPGRQLPEPPRRGRDYRRIRTTGGEPVHRLLLREVPAPAARGHRPQPGHRHPPRHRLGHRHGGLMTDSSPHPDSPHPDVASAASAPGITYASSGVDTAAGDRAVELMKEAVAATHGPEVIGGIGAFAGLVDVSALKAYE